MRLSSRASAVAAVAVVLLLVGSATAYGSWARSRPLDSDATLTAGTIGLASAWTSPLSTTAMWPGQSRVGTFRLTHSGNGRWNYAVAVTTSGTLAPDTTVALTTSTGPGVCGTTPVTPGAWSATPLATGASVDVCVTVTLSATAPSASQGRPLTLAVVGSARNQPTY